MDVLLSIKPEYVDKIADGTKLYEFRKSVFKNSVDKIWVYSSSPVKKIVGKIIVEDIVESTPAQLWLDFQKHAGIDKIKFFKYFEGKEKGYAIKIKEFIPFDKHINPYVEKNNFTPPQSYAYLSNILPTLAS